MSAAESETPAATAEEGPGAFVESAGDEHETQMAYDASSRVPWWVIVVWAFTVIGFVAYVARYVFPDLAQWGRP